MVTNQKICLKKIIYFILLLLITAGILSGCEGREEVSGQAYEVYYFADDKTGIFSAEVSTELTEPSEVAGYLIHCLRGIEGEPVHSAVLGEGSGSNGFYMNDGQIIIDFTPEVDMMPTYMSALMRAAVTRTLTQIEGIDTVACTVNGAAMTDSKGEAIGPMSADSFVENAGTQINPDEQTTLVLYFASEDGSRLVKVNRKVTYSSNISMDKLVMEQLIAGPAEGESGYPVISPDTKIISVTTQDGICYVNLDSGFLAAMNNVSVDVAIYSIVDSLVELDTINKVQFAVDDNTDAIYRETISLSTPFDRNLDLLD